MRALIRASRTRLHQKGTWQCSGEKPPCAAMTGTPEGAGCGGTRLDGARAARETTFIPRAVMLERRPSSRRMRLSSQLARGGTGVGGAVSHGSSTSGRLQGHEPLLASLPAPITTAGAPLAVPLLRVRAEEERAALRPGVRVEARYAKRRARAEHVLRRGANDLRGRRPWETDVSKMHDRPVQESAARLHCAGRVTRSSCRPPVRASVGMASRGCEDDCDAALAETTAEMRRRGSLAWGARARAARFASRRGTAISRREARG